MLLHICRNKTVMLGLILLTTVANAATVFEKPSDFQEMDLSNVKNEIDHTIGAILIENLFWQRQKMESMETEMGEFRAIITKQGEKLERIDKVVAKLQFVIQDQGREMNTMEQEILKLKTQVSDKENTLKQVKQQHMKIIDGHQSRNQNTKKIKTLKTIKLMGKENTENNQSKTVTQNDEAVTVVRTNKKTESDFSYEDRNQLFDNITSTESVVNVSEIKLFEVPINTQKQLRNGKRKLQKREITTEGTAFSAYLSHFIEHMGPGHTVKCDRVILNDGNGYSPITGIFTVPQTGVYLLTFNFGIWSINDFTEINLVVNNQNLVDATGQVKSVRHRETSGNTVITHLDQGDSVWLESQQQDSEVISNPFYRWTTFSGVLLY